MPIQIAGTVAAATEAKESGGGAPIPEGSYLATIYEVETAEYSETSKNPGKPHLVLTVKIAEGDQKGRTVRFVQVPLFTQWSSGSTAFTLYQFLDAIGGSVDEDGTLNFPADVDDFSDLAGREVKVRIRHEDDFKDPTIKRARVGRFLPQDAVVTGAKPVVEPVSTTNRFTS